MANLRFHEKYHGTLHHTVSSPGLPGSGTDPIASKYKPFVGDFHLAGALSASNDSTIIGDLALGMKASDATCRLALTGGTTQAEGIQFGTDTFLYRFSANYLRTSGSLHLNGDIVAEGAAVINTASATNKLSVNTTDTDGIVTANTTDTTDILNLKSANTSQFVVKSTGSVGIGGAPTTGMLHIKTSDDSSELVLENQSGKVGKLNIDSAGNFEILAGTGEEIQMFVNSSTRALTIDSSGKVGLGQTTPVDELHLAAGAGVQAKIRVEKADSPSRYTQYDYGNVNVTPSNDGWRIKLNGDSKFTMDQDGDVGIGTTLPATKLHVKDGDATIEQTGDAQLLIKSGNTNNGYIQFNDGNNSGSIQYSHNDNTMTFKTGTASGVERLKILSDGKMVIVDPGGAGTGAAPIIGTYLLDIQGPVVQSTNAASSFYSLGMRRSSSSLTNPDIYDINGHGLVLGRNSGAAVLTISKSASASGPDVDGVGIGMVPENGKHLSVAGHVNINGDLTVQGTFTKSAASVTIHDPVIELGTEGEITNDGYDRGLMLAYGDGSTALSGFFGMERNTGKFVFYKSATWDSTGNNASGSLGPIKASNLEATSQIYSYGDLRVDDDAIINKIKECSSGDITTINTTFIKPLAEDKIYTQSRNISLMGSSSDATTVSIGRDAILVGDSNQLYVHGTSKFNGGTYHSTINFTNYTGGVSPNSSDSAGNLFLMVNGGTDNRVRHANATQIRSGLGLSDAAITTVADIRSSTLPLVGGTVTGHVAIHHDIPQSLNNNAKCLRLLNLTSGGVALGTDIDDRGRVVVSRNISTTGSPEQFEIHHDSSRTSIINRRNSLAIAGSTSDSRIHVGDSQTWALFLDQGANSLQWGRTGVTKHTVWHSGNLDPQAYGVHTLQPNYVGNGGGGGFTGAMTGTVTINQLWLDHCVKSSENASNGTTGKVWSTQNHGPNSGLNADKLDNLQASSFCRTDATSTFRIGFKWTTGGSHANTAAPSEPWSHYAMYREGSHAGDNPYRSIVDGFTGPGAGHAKLASNWHRGINYRAHSSYGGHQFYNDTYYHSSMSRLKFSIGRGDSYVRTHGPDNNTGGTGMRHRTYDGQEYKYLHEGNMGSLVNATTFDGQDSVDFMKKHDHASDGGSYDLPPNYQSHFRYKRRGFYGTSHKGHSGQMLQWGHGTGSTSSVQLWSHYNNGHHYIRTMIDGGSSQERWTDWSRIWTDVSLTSLSQLINDNNYVRFPAHSKYEMDQVLNKSDHVNFAGVSTHHIELYTNSGKGIEIQNDQGNHFIRFENRENTYRAAAHRFQARDGRNLLYVDDKGIEGRGNTGRAVLYGALEFRDKPGGGSDTDSYYIYKHRHSANNNELRMVIGDNRGSEAFSIWDSDKTTGAVDF